MKRMIAAMLTLSVVSMFTLGCAEKSEVKTEKTITTPQGKTTETQTTEVKKSGENPP